MCTSSATLSPTLLAAITPRFDGCFALKGGRHHHHRVRGRRGGDAAGRVAHGRRVDEGRLDLVAVALVVRGAVRGARPRSPAAGVRWAIELGGAFAYSDSNVFVREALQNAVCYDDDPATARFLFVSTVPASIQTPLWVREAPPDPALLKAPGIHDANTQTRTSTVNVLALCAQNLCVRSARAVLASRQFLRSTVFFRFYAVSAAVDAYLESSRGNYGPTLAPQMLMLDDQPGFVGVLRGQEKIDWIRELGGRSRARYSSVYRRGEAMGEILRAVAGADEIASIDAHLALLRMVIGNLERYPPLPDSD